MLMPRRMKHRKVHKMPTRGKSRSCTRLAFGDFGIKITTAGKITARQIEAARRAIARHCKRGAKVWIRVFPDRPVTKHGEGQRMGKGKGSVDSYEMQVKPGRIVFEMKGVTEELSRGALSRAAAKLPMKSRIVSSSDD